MDLNETLELTLDHLRDHGTVVREVESGPWVTATWSLPSEAGDIRGTVCRLKDSEFRYARTMSVGKIHARSVFGQDDMISGGSVEDLAEIAAGLSRSVPLASHP